MIRYVTIDTTSVNSPRLQGCIHGTLTLNHMSLMFTPHNMDPLVMELGAVRFEIILPISDITYAALTKDVTPPTR